MYVNDILSSRDRDEEEDHSPLARCTIGDCCVKNNMISAIAAAYDVRIESFIF